MDPPLPDVNSHRDMYAGLVDLIVSGLWEVVATDDKGNKKAELLQRRPCDASNIWVPWKISRVLTTPKATFPEICNGLLFRSILRMCVQYLKFVALPVPEIIGGTQKIWAVPGYAHAPFSLSFLMGFCSDGDIAAFVLQHATFSHPTSSLPQFPLVPLGLSGWPLGYEERRCWANCPCN